MGFIGPLLARAIIDGRHTIRKFFQLICTGSQHDWVEPDGPIVGKLAFLIGRQSSDRYPGFSCANQLRGFGTVGSTGGRSEFKFPSYPLDLYPFLNTAAQPPAIYRPCARTGIIKLNLIRSGELPLSRLHPQMLISIFLISWAGWSLVDKSSQVV